MKFFSLLFFSLFSPLCFAASLENSISTQHSCFTLQILKTMFCITQNARQMHKIQLEKFESIVGTANDSLKYLNELYMHVRFEYYWWQVEENIILIIKDNKRIDKISLINDLVLMENALSDIFLKEFQPKYKTIMEKPLKRLKKLKECPESTLLYYKNLIGLMKLIDSIENDSPTKLYSSFSFQSEALAISIAIIHMIKVEDSKPDFSIGSESCYYSKSLELEEISRGKLGLLKNPKSLEFAHLKQFVLLTTKKTWYSEDIEKYNLAYISSAQPNEIENDKDKSPRLCSQNPKEPQVQKPEEIEQIPQKLEEQNVISTKKDTRKGNKYERKKTKQEVIEKRPREVKGDYPEKEQRTFGFVDPSCGIMELYRLEKERKARLAEEHREKRKKEEHESKEEKVNSNVETSLEETLEEVKEVQEIEADNKTELEEVKEADDETELEEVKVLSRSSSPYRGQTRNSVKFCLKSDQNVIISGNNYETLCKIFRTIQGTVTDKKFRNLVQSLGGKEIPGKGPSGTSRVFSLKNQKSSIHIPHRTGEFDWKRAGKFLKKAGFTPNDFELFQ